LLRAHTDEKLFSYKRHRAVLFSFMLTYIVNALSLQHVL